MYENANMMNRRVVTTFGGVLRQRILDIQTSGIYIYIFNSFTSNESHHNRRTYLTLRIYKTATPTHLPTNFHFHFPLLLPNSQF